VAKNPQETHSGIEIRRDTVDLLTFCTDLEEPRVAKPVDVAPATRCSHNGPDSHVVR
jgi:hypothetical protein